MTLPSNRTVHPWLMLALGVAAQTAGTIFVAMPAFLIPQLQDDWRLSLAEAGAVASAPTLGLVLTLVAWGAIADRYGERVVLSLGLALTATASLAILLSDGFAALCALLVLGGMAAASTNAASGRVVVGWFEREQRGFAMGVRQIAQPLGVTVAALAVPSLGAVGGASGAAMLRFVLATVLALACWVGVVNPPRASAEKVATLARPRSPYRASGFLWRIHGVALMLVIPQFTVTTFGLVWLVGDLGWAPLAAGVAIGVSQFVGAMGRIVLGLVSDKLASRVRLLRWVAAGAALTMLVLGLAGAYWQSSALIVTVVLIVASTVTVADNGLTFTSVAEGAGAAWAGRAFGIHNTGQYLAASAVGPVVGAAIAALGFPLAFAAVAVAPLLAMPLVPRRDEDVITPPMPKETSPPAASGTAASGAAAGATSAGAAAAAS